MSSRVTNLRPLAAGLALFADSGCCLFQQNAMQPIQADAPPQVLPDAPPATDASPRRPRTFRSNRPAPIYGYSPRPRGNRRREPIARDRAPLDPVLGDALGGQAPRRQSEQQSRQRPSGPQLLPIEPPAAATLVLNVTVNERAQLGGGATFEIVVHNPTERAVDDVVIEARFDEALLFPGRPEKKIRRSLGRLDAGQRRELAVMLNSETAGRHCARFTLIADGEEAASKNVCVEFDGDNAAAGARRF